MTTLRIVFAGTPAFGIPCLDALYASHHHLVALYTQPDRPAGRGQKLQVSAIKQWGLDHAIPIYQPIDFKSLDAVKTLVGLAPDLMVVIAYGLILPKAVLAIPRLGCINVHASLLPRWRGAAPIQHAILAGDAETGVTIMRMDVGMDTGDCLYKQSCAILSTDTSETVHQRLSLLAPNALSHVIEALIHDQSKPERQNPDGVTYAPKIQKQHAAIDWTQPATVIDRCIRGYYPWPIAYTHIEAQRLQIHQAHPIEYAGLEKPGTLVALSAGGLVVNTGQDALCITRIQCPGGKPMSVHDYLNGKSRILRVGGVFE